MGASESRECGCCNYSAQEGATQMQIMKASVMSPRFAGSRRGYENQNGNGAHGNPPDSDDVHAQARGSSDSDNDKFGVGLVFKTSRDGKMVRKAPHALCVTQYEILYKHA
jgi:hypothetical protein